MRQKAFVKNRWLMALSAVGVHLPIGSIYAYSVLILPLYDLHGWSRSAVVAAFSAAILLLGFSAAFLGPVIQRLGPGRAARLAALLYAAGLVVAAWGVRTGSYALFLAGYGALSGIGLGIAYVTPVTTLLRWFPDRKGLATGMAVMGFGFGSLVFGPIMAWLIALLSVWPALCLLAAVYGVMMVAASCYLAPPPEGWRPEGYVASPESGDTEQSGSIHTPVRNLLQSRRFLCLWGMLFINIGCGISIIALASPMAQETIGLSALQAAGLIGIMGLCNGLGRFFWAWLSDIAGRAVLFLAFFLLQTFAFGVLANTGIPWIFEGSLLLIVSCYGGGFALLPAFLSDMFGTSRVPALFGYALTAWGIAGLAGPTASAALAAWTGSYQAVLQLFAGLTAGGAGLAGWLLFDIRKKIV